MLLSSERISVTEQAASDSAASDAGEIPRISPFSASDWVGSFSASVRVGPFSATGKYDSLKVGSCELCDSEIDPASDFTIPRLHTPVADLGAPFNSASEF